MLPLFLVALLLLSVLALRVAAQAAPEAAPPPLRKVVVRVTVPEGTPTVFMPGNLEQLGPWDPSRFALEGTGRERTATLEVPDGTTLEYKFTLGSWDREALGAAGSVPPNHTLVVDGDKEVVHEIGDFRKETSAYLDEWEGSGVEGRLVYWRDVASEHLERTRHVGIYLPPAYDEQPDARFPVIYMSDGQNVFDPRIANTGVDWGIDEAVQRGVAQGLFPPQIVVGVWCTDHRREEYSPWERAGEYSRFLIQELMPRVNAEFRTLTGPEHTTHIGSSMGGLLTFHLCRTHPEVFGRGGCVSIHFPFLEAYVSPEYRDGLAPGDPLTPLILREIAAGAVFPRGPRLWFDHGTLGIDATYEPIQREVDAWLRAQGWVEGVDFVTRKYEGANHNEAAWRARMDDVLAFVLQPGPEPVAAAPSAVEEAAEPAADAPAEEVAPADEAVPAEAPAATEPASVAEPAAATP